MAIRSSVDQLEEGNDEWDREWERDWGREWHRFGGRMDGGMEAPVRSRIAPGTDVVPLATAMAAFPCPPAGSPPDSLCQSLSSNHDATQAGSHSAGYASEGLSVAVGGPGVQRFSGESMIGLLHWSRQRSGVRP